MHNKNYLILSFVIASISVFSQTATWSDNVACIIYTRCVNCHNPKGIAPFSLVDYSDAALMSSAIKSSTQAKRMPPWPPQKEYRSFAHERVLTQEEINILANWADNGAPSGDLAAAPPAPVITTSEEITSPDIRLQIPTFTIPSAFSDIYHCFSLATNTTTDQFITGVEVVPGNRAVVHHVLVFADTTGATAGLDAAYAGPGYPAYGGVGTPNAFLVYAWVPGGGALFPPARMGVKLPRGSRIALQIHYPVSAVGSVDSTKVNLQLAPGPLRTLSVSPVLNHGAALIDGPLFIPANTVRTFHARYQIPPVNVTTLSVAPHMHVVGKSVKAYAVTPSFDTIPLINIPKWDFHWQGAYNFRQPLRIPANSWLYAEAVYDNTSANPNNPSFPPQDVRLGESTDEEMMLIYFAYTIHNAGDENIIVDTTTVKPTYLNCSFALGTQDRKLESVKIYPNPSSSYIEVQVSNLNFENAQLSLYDISGRHLKSQKVTSYITFIPVETLSSGTYFLRYEQNGQTETAKLVIQH